VSDELLSKLLDETMKQGQQLAVVCEGMEKLLGNGQPGIIKNMQNDIDDLKADNNKRLGATGAFAFLVTGWEVLKHFLKIQ
jgi:hypothetical protein